jgi:uroporphyrinogen decarboxylase
VGVEESNFIRACYGCNDGRIPIWIMRQAGRYLPEYQKIREDVSFLELCKSPKLIAEVVRQPIARFDLDAAILFSDILTPFEPMGVKVDFPDGGPQLEFTIREPNDVKQLSDFDIEKDLHFVFEGIREIKKILPEKPLIGFAGSPLTLASYLIEGGGSKTFSNAKRFIHEFPKAAEELFELLADVVARYLAAQVDAGADAVQVFDSWGGVLSNDDYRRWSANPVRKIFDRLTEKRVPRIIFVNNLSPYIDTVSEIDCEVVGVDYRMQLADAARSLPGKSVQGNLDPAVLFGSTRDVIEQTTRIIDSVDNTNRLIFNLGHGIMPETPIESVQALVETVHNYR